MAAVKEVFKRVLEDIVPIPERSPLPHINDFIHQLNATLKSLRINATAVLGGSFAKNVWLRGDHDVDIFVRFNRSYDDGKLSDLLARALKRWKPLRVHGSRDYFIIKNVFNIEVVPCRQITTPAQAVNVTDYSFWHVAWVNKHGAKLKNDIRIAKKFCKAQGVYGAESYINGFSGHVLDLLVIHYKGFLPLLKAAAQFDLNQKIIIDVPRAYNGRVLLEMNESKINGPLVVVDPIDPSRNAAAAVGEEALALFVAAAKKFIAHPSLSFFERQSFNLVLAAKKGVVLQVIASAPANRTDPIGVKLRQAYLFMRNGLVDFKVVDGGWEWKDSVVCWFVCANKKLSSTIEVEGPPLRFAAHVAAFKKKHKRTMMRKRKIVAIVARPHTDPFVALCALAKNEYVVSRMKNIRVKKVLAKNLLVKNKKRVHA